MKVHLGLSSRANGFGWVSFGMLVLRGRVRGSCTISIKDVFESDQPSPSKHLSNHPHPPSQPPQLPQPTADSLPTPRPLLEKHISSS